MLDDTEGADRRKDPDDHGAIGSGEIPGVRRLPAMRLFLRRLPGARRPWELLRLDSWGDTLLGTKLRGELATGYAILLAVCVVEICAWTLLFNYVFQGADVAVSGWTLAAVVLGVLWGIGIFTIDKNLITSDLLRPGVRKYAGVLARGAVVLGSAYLTYQPIEHLVFRPVIEERLKQETLREEAVAYVRTRAAEAKRKAAEDMKPEDDRAVQRQQGKVALQDGAVEELEKRWTDANVALLAAKSARQRANAWLGGAKSKWDELPHDEPLSKEAADARKNWQNARSAVSQANQAVDRASAELETATKRLNDGKTAQGLESKSLDRIVDDASARLRQETQRLEKEEEKQRQFFDQLRSTKYGTHVAREDGRPFEWKPAGALERAALLARVLEGAPLEWPRNTDPAMAHAAERLCGVSDNVASERDRSDVFGLWLLIMLVAGAFPALSIFYKFTMSRELKLYYSVEAQAAAGNPDALMLQRAHGAGAARGHRLSQSTMASGSSARAEHVR